MRTSTFITLAIASLMISITHAKKPAFVKRKQGGNLITNPLAGDGVGRNPLALAGALTGGVTSGGSGITTEARKKKKRSATSSGLPIIGGVSGVGSGTNVAGVDVSSVLGDVGGGSKSGAAAAEERKRRKRAVLGGDGLPVVGSLLGGGGSKKKAIARSDVQGGGKGGLPLVGNLLGGGKSIEKNTIIPPPTKKLSTPSRRGDRRRPGGKGKGRGRGRRGDRVKPYSEITANQVKIAEAARAKEGGIGSGLSLLNGLVGKRSVYYKQEKRGTGFPEIRETVGKTILVLDDDDTTYKTTKVASKAAADEGL